MLVATARPLIYLTNFIIHLCPIVMKVFWSGWFASPRLLRNSSRLPHLQLRHWTVLRPLAAASGDNCPPPSYAVGAVLEPLSVDHREELTYIHVHARTSFRLISSDNDDVRSVRLRRQVSSELRKRANTPQVCLLQFCSTCLCRQAFLRK